MISSVIAKELGLSLAGHIIDGSETPSIDERTIEVVAPRDRQVMGSAAQAGEHDVQLRPES